MLSCGAFICFGGATPFLAPEDGRRRGSTGRVVRTAQAGAIEQVKAVAGEPRETSREHGARHAENSASSAWESSREFRARKPSNSASIAEIARAEGENFLSSGGRIACLEAAGLRWQADIETKGAERMVRFVAACLLVMLALPILRLGRTGMSNPCGRLGALRPTCKGWRNG
jgi:hypothetical protein